MGNDYIKTREHGKSCCFANTEKVFEVSWSDYKPLLQSLLHPTSYHQLPSMALPQQEGANERVFEERQIPGKGRGLVAIREIPIGTRILCQKPLLTLNVKDLSDRGAYLNDNIAEKVEALARDAKYQFLSNLRKSWPDLRPLTGIFETNALPHNSRRSRYRGRH